MHSKQTRENQQSNCLFILNGQFKTCLKSSFTTQSIKLLQQRWRLQRQRLQRLQRLRLYTPYFNALSHEHTLFYPFATKKPFWAFCFFISIFFFQEKQTDIRTYVYNCWSLTNGMCECYQPYSCRQPVVKVWFLFLSCPCLFFLLILRLIFVVLVHDFPKNVFKNNVNMYVYVCLSICLHMCMAVVVGGVL